MALWRLSLRSWNTVAEAQRRRRKTRGEVSVFTVYQYEQPACVPLGMDNTCTYSYVVSE